jgi:hypothetical protein
LFITGLTIVSAAVVKKYAVLAILSGTFGYSCGGKKVNAISTIAITGPAARN